MNLKSFLEPRGLLKKTINKLGGRQFPSVEAFLSRSSVELNLKRDKTLKAGSAWDELLDTIIEEMNASPMSFLRSPTVSQTIHPNEQDLARRYFDEMLQKPFFINHILPKVQECSMGNPYLCEFFPFASPLSMQHLYYINLIYEKFRAYIPESSIEFMLEIGGGYGNLCRIMRSLGFKGKYVIADLPDMHKIQKHYLSHVLPRDIEDGSIEFCLVDELGDLQFSKESVFFATFSLSEMPMELRNKIEPLYKKFGYLLCAHNRTFGGVDNYKYFTDLAGRLEDSFDVECFDDPHRRARFMVGKCR